MINAINNVKLKHLHRIPHDDYEEYRRMLSFLKPKNMIKGHQANDIFWLTFDQVELIKRTLDNPKIENLLDVFEVVFGIDKKKVLNCRLIPFYHAYNHIVNETVKIIERENTTLGIDEGNLTKEERLMRTATGDSLNIFGVLNSLDVLAIRYNTHPDIIKDWKYGYCYSLLLKINVENQINRDYHILIKANS